MNIEYTSNCAMDYANAIAACITREELANIVQQWKLLASDAIDQVPSNGLEFAFWREGLARERDKVYAGDEFFTQFNRLLMPETLVMVAQFAHTHNLMWGQAYHEMRRMGKIVVKDGIAKVVR